MHTEVLVVDDSADLRVFLVSVLEDEGYTVWQASDGKPALERLRQHPTGLVVVLDLHMPVVTGFEVLRIVDADAALRARHTYIMMSANTDVLPPRFIELLARWCIPVLTKPFDHNVLLAAVAAAAERLQPAS